MPPWLLPRRHDGVTAPAVLGRDRCGFFPVRLLPCTFFCGFFPVASCSPGSLYIYAARGFLHHRAAAVASCNLGPALWLLPHSLAGPLFQVAPAGRPSCARRPTGCTSPLLRCSVNRTSSAILDLPGPVFLRRALPQAPASPITREALFTYLDLASSSRVASFWRNDAFSCCS